MAEDKLRGLAESDKKRKEVARAKAKAAIESLEREGKKVNFNSVYQRCGVSKSFLYSDDEIGSMIQALRIRDTDNEMNRRAKYDQTARSKDVIIAAKDKKIAALEAENKQMKAEIQRLQAALYKLM